MRNDSRLPLLLFMLLLAWTPAPADQECEPIAGAEDLIAPGRILLLGELHGTEQSPAFAARVACNVAERGLAVVVGLELTADDQDRADRYLDSAGLADDRAALIQSGMWTRSYQDGRNSVAMVELIESVRRLKSDGRDASLLFFDVPTSGGGRNRDRGMAARVAGSADARPQAVHVILTGNIHSRTSRGNRFDPEFESMGYLLRGRAGTERVVALDVGHQGGTAWICTPECGIVTLAGNSTGSPGSIEIDDSSRPSGHQGWYHVGTLSASVPANGSVEAPLESPTPPKPARPIAKPDRKTQGVDSPSVQKMQGDWQAYQNGVKSWTMEFDGRAFHAVMSPDEWYRGEIFVRPGDDLSEIDFLIEDCTCGFKGESSDAIYRWEGETVRVGAPSPGTARPTFFNEQKGEVFQLRRIED